MTEEVTGLDLVRLQLRVAAGATLADVGLARQGDVPNPRGVALQARVNLETMAADGRVRPAGGVLTAYEPPSGPGVRVDGFGYAGYRTSARYDSLLAKVIVHGADLPSAARQGARALGEFRLTGVGSNIPFLRALTGRIAGGEAGLHTRYVEEHIASLAEEAASEAAGAAPRRLRRAGAPARRSTRSIRWRCWRTARAKARRPPCPREARSPPAAFDEIAGPEGASALRAPLQGTIVSLAVEPGDAVRAGQTVAIMESMKMEHVIAAHVAGYVREITVAAGDTVFEDHPLVFIEAADIGDAGHVETEEVDLDAIRPDLQLILDRHAKTLDAARPDAVARRRKTGQRTTRENVDDLVDPGSFVEYGSLVVAARRRRNTLEELIDQTPADGLVMGLGRVNGRPGRRGRRPLRGDGLRLHGAGGHAGRLQPPQDGPADRAGDRRTACRRCSSARAAAGGRATPRAAAASCAASSSGAGCRASRRWWGSPPAAASPATPRCSAAAT